MDFTLYKKNTFSLINFSLLVLLSTVSLFSGLSLFSVSAVSNESGNSAALNEDAPALGNSILVKTKNPVTQDNNPITSIVKNKISNFGNNSNETITAVKDNVLIANFENSTDSKIVLDNLKNSSDVEIAQPIYQYTPFADYNPTLNTLYSSQWYLRNQASAINMPGAWGKIGGYRNYNCPTDDRCGGNNSVSIALIDSGVNPNSSDLPAERFDTPNGARFYYNGDNTCPTNQFYQTLNLGSSTNPLTINFCRALASHPDDSGHGTSVASVMALKNNSVGGVGVGYNIKVLPIALNGPFSFNSFILAESIDYAVSKGVKVVNLSMGTSVDDPYLRQSIQNATNNGVIVVASSGNCGNKTAFTCNIGSNNTFVNPTVYPAAYPFVVAVGASNYNTVTQNIQKSSYSSYGNYVDFVAPVGEGSDPEWGVLAMNQNGLLSDQYVGTSYSSPMVAALIALGYSIAPDIQSDLLINSLKTSSTDLGSPGFDQFFGNGLINASAFIEDLTQYDTSHSDWEMVDSINGEINTISFNNRLVMSVRGRGNQIFTRSSTDGKTWSQMVNSGGTLGSVEMSIFGNRLFQAVRGTDNVIYTRSTSDGINWNNWNGVGATLNQVKMTTFNNRLFQAVRGTDNVIYTRSTSDGNNWSNWNGVGATFNPVEMLTFNNRLFQAVGGTDNGLYIRSTSDGNNWSNWAFQGVDVSQPPDFINFNNRLVMTVRGLNNEIFTRSTTDGTNWNGFVNSGGILSKTMMTINNNRLMQAIRGTNNLVYTRYSGDGINWSGWRGEGSTLNDPSILTFNGQTYLGHVGTDQKYYSRKSSNFETFTPWTRNFDVYGPVKYETFNGELITFAFTRDWKLAVRYLI